MIVTIGFLHLILFLSWSLLDSCIEFIPTIILNNQFSKYFQNIMCRQYPTRYSIHILVITPFHCREMLQCFIAQQTGIQIGNGIISVICRRHNT